MSKTGVNEYTEFFTGEEWKFIKDYKKGDKVLCYDSTNGLAVVQEPLEFVHYEDDYPFLVYDNTKWFGGIDYAVSHNQNMVFIDTENRKSSFLSPVEMLKDEDKVYRMIDSCYLIGGSDDNKLKNLIKLFIEVFFNDCVVSDDGGIVMQCTPFRRSEVSIASKGKVVRRVSKVLSDMGIECVVATGNSFVKFYCDEMVDIFKRGDIDKSWYDLSLTCRDELKRYIFSVLGYSGTARRYRNFIELPKKSSKLCDFIQYLCFSTGSSAEIYYGKNSCILFMKYRITDSGSRSFKDTDIGDNVGYRKKLNGRGKYNFVVPSGCYMVRYRGMVFAVGDKVEKGA